MDLTQLAQQYGLWAFVGYFLYKEVWPFFKDKIWPAAIAEHDAQHQADRDLQERILSAFEKNTVALTELRTSMEQQTSAMTEIKEQLRHLVEDVVEVRVKMGMPGTRRKIGGE